MLRIVKKKDKKHFCNRYKSPLKSMLHSDVSFVDKNLIMFRETTVHTSQIRSRRTVVVPFLFQGLLM